MPRYSEATTQAAPAPKAAAPAPAAPKAAAPAPRQAAPAARPRPAAPPAGRQAAKSAAKISTWIGGTPEERKAISAEREERTLNPFIEKLQQVAALRKQKMAGPQAEYTPGGELLGREVYASLKPISASLRPGAPTVGVPRYRPDSPTASELDVPVKGAATARALAQDYTRARQSQQAVMREYAQKAADPRFPRSQLSEYERGAQAALQRVAQLRAGLREFGWADDAEVEEKFGPK